MTDWRAELIKDIINAMYKVENMQCSKLLVMARAALAVAEPAIREQADNTLREENARLRDALKPFSSLFLYPDDLGVEHAENIRSDPDWDDDANDMQPENVFVFRGDIRRIRAAIQEGGE